MCMICGGMCGPGCVVSTDAAASLAGFLWLFVTIRAKRVYGWCTRKFSKSHQKPCGCACQAHKKSAV